MIEFDSTGKCLNCGSEGEGGKAGFDREGAPSGEVNTINAIALSSACGPEDVYDLHNHAGKDGLRAAFVRVLGSPLTNPACPPPSVAPSIGAQWASSVGTFERGASGEDQPALLERHHLLPRIRPCSLLGRGLRRKAAGAGLAADDEGPQRRAHHRGDPPRWSRARDHLPLPLRRPELGRGPVRGVGGAEGADGAEGTFETFAPEAAESCPANEAFRSGPSAKLPDCRAYEMVSPLDKEGGDIVAQVDTAGYPMVLDQSSTSGDKLAYGSYRAFGDAVAAPRTSQYVARRTADGWQSHYMLGPHGRLNEKVPNISIDELRVLSPDLCEAWIETFSEPTLAPAAQHGQKNLYRHTYSAPDCGGSEGWEALTTVAPPHGNFGEGNFDFQGVAADGSASIFVAEDNLATEGVQPPDLGGEGFELYPFQLYYQPAGEGKPYFPCVLPSGAAVGRSCSAGTMGVGFGKTGRLSTLTNALSADGQRVFWSTPAPNDGQLYLRSNPAAPESAHLLGTAIGKGDLIGPASGIGNAINGSKNISALEEKGGHFAVGQVVSGPGIPAGDKVVSKATELSGKLKLTLGEKAGVGAGAGEEISGEASATVANLSTESGAFEVGQEVSGPGIAFETTILACTPACGGGATGLTLSAPATETEAQGSLGASSECTEASKACTVAVSAKGEALSGASSSTFWAATPSGSKALYGTAKDLYLFDVQSGATTTIAHGVVGVAGTSEDLSRIYFGSEEALAVEPNSEGELPVAGQANLYLYEAGAPTRFVATVGALSSIASSSWAFSQAPILRTARATADGQHLAFMSQGSLSGYDNADAANGEADSEVFLYDATGEAGKGKLACASCNPSGARPQGQELEAVTLRFWAAAELPVWKSSLYAGRVMSDDGRRLYFESSDALVARDSNGATDVYQWEAPGKGRCSQSSPSYSKQDEGCVSLISSGQSPGKAELFDVDPEGNNVFFSPGRAWSPRTTASSTSTTPA